MSRRRSQPDIPGQPIAPLEIHLLGAFAVRVGDRLIIRYTNRVPKRWTLLYLLALAPDHRLPVEQVCRLLWPAASTAEARGNLNEAVLRLRQLLDATRPGGASPYLGRGPQTLQLCPDAPLRLDIEDFEAEAQRAMRARDPAMFERAAARYTGDLCLLPERPPSVEQRQADLRSLYAQLLTKHAALLTEREPIAAAMAVQRRLSRDAGLYATPPQRLASHAAAGQRAATSLPPTLPPMNVSIARHPIIGRQRELQAIRVSFRSWRLVTLHGPAGSGKTTLAEEAARQGCDDGYEGIWEVPLDQLTNGESIAAAVGRTLDLQVAEMIEPEHIATALAGRRVLLLLDNCEQVRHEVGALCEYLIPRCPHLRILATSRYPLQLRQEWRLPVPPLEVPPREHTSAEQVRDASAVRLFVRHARRQDTRFQLTDENAATVAKICRQLGGLPLAIELVSARLASKLMSVPCAAQRLRAIERELDDMLDLPAHADATIPPRQRTLRKTLDWSFHLLHPSQRRFLMRLAIFSGGWTLDAAAAVCADEGSTREEVERRLDLLREWSLISSEEMGGETCYTMLEFTRQYLSQRLKRQKDPPPLQERHAAWCARLAEEALGQLETAAQVRALQRLDREQGNLRAALRWTLDQARPALALRLVVALWRYWWIRGWFADGITLIVRALSLCAEPPASDGAHASLYAQARAGLGILLAEQGYCAASEHDGLSLAEWHMRESIVLLRTLDDARALAATLSLAGMVAYNVDHFDVATRHLYESLRIRRRLGDEIGIADCRKNLGTVAFYREQYALAERRLMDCLRTRRQLGDLAGMAYSLINLGNVAYKQHEYERAEANYLESLAWRWALDARGGVASCLAGLLVNAVERGLYLRAAWLSGVETELKRALGTRLSATDQRLCDERLEVCRQRANAPEALAGAYARGAACPLDLAVACILIANDTHARGGTFSQPFVTMRARLGRKLTAQQRNIAALIAYGESLEGLSGARKPDFHATLMKIPATVRAELDASIAASHGQEVS